MNHSHNRVFFYTSLIAAITLGLLLTGAAYVSQFFFPDTNWGKGLKLGLELLLFWVMVTSAVRTVNKSTKEISGLRLLYTGILTGLMGALFQFLFLNILAWFKVSWVEVPNYKTFAFYAALGFVAAVISLIHLRVKNRMLGNVMEIAFIAIVAVIAFWIMTR